MKTPYVLIWGDYDGTFTEYFTELPLLEERVTCLMKQNMERDYGFGILFSGFIIDEYKFVPKETAIKYKAVST